MEHIRKHKWEWLIAVTALLMGAVLFIQCGESGSTGDGGPQTCAVHEDCDAYYSCILAQGICGSDPNAFPCAGDADCVRGYSCYIAPGVDMGKCIPEPVVEDGDEEQPPCTTCNRNEDCSDTQICQGGCCEAEFPTCKGDTDCWPNQICVDGYCEYKPEDGDDVIVDGDPDADPDPEVGPACDGGVMCQTSADCSNGQVCGPGNGTSGCCMAPCTETGCPSAGQICNPNNGYCEWCEEACGPSQCCNYHENFWYCGTCCKPPCAEGQACQGGRCIELSCPTCDDCERCGADTGYRCVDDPNSPNCVDGDTSERGLGGECLPANASCVEGVDQCCSGTCLMGTCL